MLGFRHIAAAANGEFVLNITANAVNPDVYALAMAAGWNGSSLLTINITASLINTLVISNSWSAPNGLNLIIGAATRIGGVRGVNSAGGTALTVQQSCAITNNGILSGGGGAGGVGAGAYAQYGAEIDKRAWAEGGAAGNGQGFGSGTTNIVGATSGASGVYAVVTGVVAPGGTANPWVQAGAGGNGGTWGASGDSGSNYTLGGSNNTGGLWTASGSGQRAGYALHGNSFVTWRATGTRLGGVV